MRESDSAGKNGVIVFTTPRLSDLCYCSLTVKCTSPVYSQSLGKNASKQAHKYDPDVPLSLENEARTQQRKCCHRPLPGSFKVKGELEAVRADTRRPGWGPVRRRCIVKGLKAMTQL